MMMYVKFFRIWPNVRRWMFPGLTYCQSRHRLRIALAVSRLQRRNFERLNALLKETTEEQYNIAASTVGQFGIEAA
jgi:hypothetical protein